jgi:hypothetical protein
LQCATELLERNASVLAPLEQHPWDKARSAGGGLADFCMATDDLRGDVEAMRRRIGCLLHPH